MYAQVPREVDVKSVPNSKVVAEQLHRDDVQYALQAVDGLGHPDGLATGRDAIVTLVAHDDRLSFAGSDLGERGLHLGVQRVSGHDDDHGHVLVDQREGSVLEFTGENTLRMHVRDFFDLECTLKARRISGVIQSVWGMTSKTKRGMTYW